MKHFQWAFCLGIVIVALLNTSYGATGNRAGEGSSAQGTSSMILVVSKRSSHTPSIMEWNLTGNNTIYSPVTIPPETVIESSRYVSFLQHTVRFVDEELVLNGDFIVKGKAVFGHFDCTVLDNYGTEIHRVTTDDRAYRSDKGGKVKPLQVHLGAVSGGHTVIISFHEMRASSENGLYIRMH